jgi:hypothetical protein
MLKDKIFVQIASYRDPELIPTIKECIAKAKHPENLTFGICWQRDETENLDQFKDLPNFQIMDVPWKESKGLCWARCQIQKMWKGEEYTMQLDSHHRFLQDWDEELINMMKLTGSPKPIITAYAGMYSPKENKLLNTDPYKMVADKFTSHGTILFYPHSIEGWEKLDKPIPARFVSGHFYFTLGIHCDEYKYDPNLYFAGDEISLSIRSYTLGYDLFHPHKTVIWHEYTREGRTKHWTDFDTKNKEEGIVGETWWEMDTKSKLRLRHMLREEDTGIDLGIYDIGTVRSHKDYEDYAGINFANRVLHPDTKKGIEPPINDNSNWWELKEIDRDLNLKIDKDLIDGFDKYKFIYVGVEDESGNVLFRKDVTRDDDFVLSKGNFAINAKFKSLKEPYKYIIWPNNGEWLERKDVML